MRENQKQIPLQYASPLPPGRRPGWVWTVVGIYLTLLLGIAALPELAAWNSSSSDATGMFLFAGVGVCGFFALGAMLMVVPVRVRRGRTARRAIWFPLVGAAFLFGGLCAAAGFAAMELLNPKNGNGYAAPLIVGFGLVWVGWCAFFAFLARSLDPISLNTRLYKSLFVGSVLELVIAVPMHLVVRRRTECCVGILTGTAICVGGLVAIVALGPGVFFLFYRRWNEKYGGTVRLSKFGG